MSTKQSTLDTKGQATLRASSIPGAGNGLFATRDLGAGELIFRLQRPLVAVLDEGCLERYCSECFAEEEADSNADDDDGVGRKRRKILMCAGCKVLGFCGKVSVPLFSIYFLLATLQRNNFAFQGTLVLSVD
jgi:hypothetical protein